MRARRLTRSDLAAFSPDDLTGTVLLAPVALAGNPLRKGTRLELPIIERLIAAARSGELADSVRIAWLESGDLHEDEAALRRLNSPDALELFTVYHGQAVAAGDVVASVKVAPHVVPEALVRAGEAAARERPPLVEVRPYLPQPVAAIVEETLTPEGLERFEAGARRKVEALGSPFAGTIAVRAVDPAVAETEARSALVRTVREGGVRVVLVGGVSAGDPLSPFFAALEGLGGHILRRGVPAHPGSMIWLAELDGSRLLGLPQCGMFTMATAADLILPRLLTGEPLTGADLADLAHGGILSRDMRFRMPAYARDLIAPEG